MVLFVWFSEVLELSTSESGISDILGPFLFYFLLYKHFLLKINFTNFENLLILRTIQILLNEIVNTLM
jgi:hypothetical protein